MKKVILVLSLIFLCTGFTATYTANVNAFITEEKVEKGARGVKAFYAIDNNGKPITGIVMYYYKSGKLKSEMPSKGGRAYGIVKNYNEDGTLKLLRTYEAGILYTETPYENNVKEGVAKIYYPDNLYIEGDIDLPRIETTYKNDMKEGIEKEYTKGGILLREIPYKNGMKEGIEKYTLGAYTRETPYKNDVKEGVGKDYCRTDYCSAGNDPWDWHTVLKDEEKKYADSAKLIQETTYKNDVAVEIKLHAFDKSFTPQTLPEIYIRGAFAGGGYTSVRHYTPIEVIRIWGWSNDGKVAVTTIQNPDGEEVDVIVTALIIDLVNDKELWRMGAKSSHDLGLDESDATGLPNNDVSQLHENLDLYRSFGKACAKNGIVSPFSISTIQGRWRNVNWGQELEDDYIFEHDN